MFDNFTKYGLIIPLNDNKVVTILTVLKNVSPHIEFIIDIRPINEESSINNFLEEFCESKGIVKIYGLHCNPHHQVALKASNRTVQIFLISDKKQQKTKNINSMNHLMTF